MIQTDYAPAYEQQPVVADAYDVIVIGGGPAGATAAGLIAAAGRSVLIVERESVPRFHVGESLIPETYWTLDRLGMIGKLQATAFPKKYSVQFVSDGHKYSAPFYFHTHKPDSPSVQSWQVERGEFDKMLLDNAVEHGAVLRTDAAVMDVLWDGEPGGSRARGVKVRFKTGEDTGPREIASRVVVDASGQSAFIAKRLGLYEADDHLKKGTVWTYWKGARRDEGIDEGCTIIMQTEGKQSWFWYIPLQDDVVSVGCTRDMGDMFPGGVSAEEAYQRELARCPALQERLEGAENLTGYHATKDFSYYSSRAAGDGWVLCGDAYGFIDPVYSTGVFCALKSGEFAADAVIEGFETNSLDGRTLGAWAAEYKAGTELFRKLVYAFYAPDFNFAEFFREHPQYRTNMTDILIGDVFKPGVGEIFDAMGDIRPPKSVTKAVAV